MPHLHFLTADTRFIAVVVQRFGHTVTQVHWLPDPVHAEPHLAGPGVADHWQALSQSQFTESYSLHQVKE